MVFISDDTDIIRPLLMMGLMIEMGRKKVHLGIANYSLLGAYS